MPPKLIGSKKDNSNEKSKKKKQGVAVDAAKILKEVIHEYDIKCEYYSVASCAPLRRQMKTSMDEEKLLHRFIVDPKDRRKVDYWEDEQLPELFAPIDASSDLKSIKKKPLKNTKKEAQVLVKVLPLFEALRNKRYIYIQELFVWEVLMEHDDICAMSGMIARGIYQFVRIELVDCFISNKCLSKLAPTINMCRTLQELVLDFNEFGDEGCETLCEGLSGNKWLLQLSMCYCDLTVRSGLHLGKLIGGTAIRELFLDGNELQAEGVILLLNLLCQGAEFEAQERIDQKKIKEEQETNIKSADSRPRYDLEAPDETSSKQENISENDGSPVPSKPDKKGTKKKKGKKTKKGKKKLKSTLPSSPPVGPQINKLRVADNGIDQMGRGGNFAPMRCMQLLKTIIANSNDLEEIDLFGNDIGDLGSRQLLDGLLMRKANKLPQIGIRVGHRINQDTFDLITKMAPGSKKKRARPKKKK